MTVDKSGAARGLLPTSLMSDEVAVATPQQIYLAFMKGGAEYLQAAASLSKDILVPKYILIFHSIELFLKAFLSNKGVPIGELKSRKFGHDLVRLFEDASANGLVISYKDTFEYISWINEFHSAPLRREFVEARELPQLEKIREVAEAIESACGRA